MLNFSELAGLYVSKEEEKASLADCDLNVDMGSFCDAPVSRKTPVHFSCYDADLIANAP